MKAFLIVFIQLSSAFQQRGQYTHRVPSLQPSPLKVHRQELSTAAISVPPNDEAYSWPLGKLAFSLLPLAPGERRKTVEKCVVPNKIWTHDQIQGIVNVNVPVRQTVVALKGGGLWVHNPVAPTDELISMMAALEEKYGPVKHVVLGTVALEHKATAGPFSKCFPEAQVWLQPGQWSFPFNVPCFLYGFQTKKSLQTIPYKAPRSTSRTIRSSNPPWSDEIEHLVLGPLKFKSVGYFSETAFFHRSTKTLIVTDTIVKVDEDPPAIIQDDPRALLFHSRDDVGEEVSDSVETRRKGWRRMVQFGLIFFPSGIEVVGFKDALKDAATRVPESMRTLGTGAVPFNLYPWRWVKNDQASFDALVGQDKTSALLVAPILQKLILNREPEIVLEWADKVSEWPFKRIIPCHLSNDVKASPSSFRRAFSFLETEEVTSASAKSDDLALLNKASHVLTRVGVVAPPGEAVTSRQRKNVFTFRSNLVARVEDREWLSWFT